VCECEWKKLEVIGGRKIFLFIEWENNFITFSYIV
jgi:hypothetical protein